MESLPFKLKLENQNSLEFDVKLIQDKKKRFRQIIEFTSPISDRQNKDVVTILNEGIFFLELKKYDKAIETLEQALKNLTSKNNEEDYKDSK